MFAARDAVSVVSTCSARSGFIIVSCVDISKMPRNSVQCIMLHDVNISKTVMSIASIELTFVSYVSMLYKKGDFSYGSNVDVRSRNHYYCGKPIGIRYKF